ncbi:Metalloenzyme, LuxS/M16 peptidase-like protein [Yarrowia lipolytica]|nr:Metalloenzyme, LuxS/M16 peptidase-like protein [Yarrowia lipolytica]
MLPHLRNGLKLAMETPIVKPRLDSRDYKSVRLGNRLEALLVADKTTTMSSASLAVHAGYYDDPEDLPGLAHFCEHLMFLGTKKYPRENEYKQFILTNSGASNAFTSTQITNYHFQIKNSAFQEAVDRFAQFFIEPLFDPDCKDREINAVNSEHEKNTQLDSRRILHVSRLTGSKEHPHHKFSTGSKHTLDKPGVRDRLLEFHKNQYCASKMRLVLMGRDMGELENLVQVFEDIPNKNLPIPVLKQPMLDPRNSFLQIVPLSEKRFVKYEFEVPGWRQLGEYSVNSYYAQLVGHESPGSLYWYLKQKGWADSVSAHINYLSSEGGLFSVTVNLTTEGAQHTEEIGAALFEYLAMLRAEGPQKWFFDESKDICQLFFDFKETPTQIMSEASALSATFANKQCAASEVVSYNHLMKTYNAEVLEEFLTRLTPDNLRVTLVAPEVKDKCDLTEQHCGTKYSVSQLKKETVDKFSEALKSSFPKRFHLPQKNPYIAEEFTILNEKKEDIPLTEYYKPKTLSPTLSYFPDHMFETPKGMIIVGLNHPNASDTVRNSLLTRLACSLWSDAAEKYSYDAASAGLGLSIHRGTYGVIVQVAGFNDKLSVLLDQSYETLKSDIDPGRFSLRLERLKRALSNAKFNSSFQIIDEYLSAEVDEQQFTLEERLASIEEKEITLEEVRAHMAKIISECSPRVLVSGNFSESKAHEIHGRVIEEFKCGDVLNLPQKLISTPLYGSKIAARPSLNVDNADNCVLYYFESTQVEKARLLAYIIKEPAFTFLRTKKQLGYVARAGFERNFSTGGLSLLTQSAYHADDVKALMDEFLTVHMAAIMEKMTVEEFEKYTAGFIAQVSKPPKSLMVQSRHVWSKLCNSWGFNVDAEAIELAKTVSLEEMKQFYNELFDTDKRSLCVQINTSKESKRYDLEDKKGRTNKGGHISANI